MSQGPISFALAGVLVIAAGAKLAAPRSSADALATYGFDAPAVRRAVWTALVAVELALAAGVAAGSATAAYAAAGLLAMFALTQVSAIQRGKAGAPCACFGARSKVGWPGVIRDLVLAGAFTALPSLPVVHPTTDGWLAVGLAVAFVACAALGVAVLALAREVGMLRLRVGPSSALEIPDEGPELGGHASLIERFEPGRRADLALAVFASEGCHMCRKLEPSVASLAAEPGLAVEVFDEVRDADVWAELHVPGSPYAVALGLDGTVLAKGTFNNLAQLESVVATALRRRSGRLPAVGAPAAERTRV